MGNAKQATCRVQSCCFAPCYFAWHLSPPEEAPPPALLLLHRSREDASPVPRQTVVTDAPPRVTGNSDATKFFCQTTDSYAGRRRRKGGKCITSSPQNAGKDCFNSESDCGGTDSTTYCQETLVQTTHPGRCIASSPSNEGDGCATESDCGNTDVTKFFCQTTDSYAGRRRGKGGKCITGSPQNAGEDCFNSESDCGNTDPTKFFCQATLAESDTCDDWDPTKKGMVKAGLEGYAQCGGKAGTKECWNAWCENNCGNGDHPACVLDDTVEGAVDIHTRCKCDVEMMIEWFNDDAAPQSLTQTEDKWSESK